MTKQFEETLHNIDHEISWIDFELARQSTTESQEKWLKASKEKLLKIKTACQEYLQMVKPQK